MKSANPPKSHKNQSLDLKVFFLAPKCPRVPQDAKVEAPSMAKDTFGLRKSKICLQKTLRIQHLISMSNGREPAAEGVAHKSLDGFTKFQHHQSDRKYIPYRLAVDQNPSSLPNNSKPQYERFSKSVWFWNSAVKRWNLVRLKDGNPFLYWVLKQRHRQQGVQ